MGWLLGLEQSEAKSRGQFRCAALSSIFVLLAAQFVPSTAYPQADSRCSAIAERSDDGSVIRVCEVLFQRLWSQDAEKLTGSYVQITGYVAYLEEMPYLFASKDMYLYSGGRGGIWLRLPPSEKERFDRVASRGLPVTVAGRYSSGKGGFKALGTIEVVGRHYWEQEVPGNPPRLPED